MAGEDKDDKGAAKDATEEKVKKTSEVIMGADEPEEPIPDYEIEEEGEAETKPDAKLDAESNKKSDETKSANWHKRRRHKDRNRQDHEAKDRLLQQQRERIEEMERRFGTVDARLSSYDQQQVNQAYNNSVTAFQQAQAAYQASLQAIARGEDAGAMNAKALQDMYNAQRDIDQIRDVHEKLRSGATKQPVQQQQQADPVVVRKANAWAAKNTWFSPNGGNEDSEIADALAVRLVKEGYQANTDDFYDELTDRLAKRGIGVEQDDGDDEDDDEDDAPAQRQSRQKTAASSVRKAPPVAGSGGRGDMGGKVTAKVPTALINTLKQNGLWDNKEKRDRIIHAHLKMQKEQAARS